MRKTEQEINAEKALKSRPDLVPSKAYGRCCCDKPYGWRTSVTDVLGPKGASQEAVCVLFQWARQRVGSNDWTNLLALGKVMAYGRAKHGYCTWRVAGTKQANPEEHWASACRRLCEYLADEWATEEGSGLPVLLHAMTQCVITMDLLIDPPGSDKAQKE